MDLLRLVGTALGAIAAAAGVLAFDAWIHSKDSIPQQLWAAYVRWYREPAEYLLDRTPAKTFAIYHALQLLACLLIAVVVFGGHPIALVGALAAGILGPPYLYLRRVEKRREALQQQIDPALQFIANALQVTPNLEEALSMVAEHMKPPISEEVSRVVTAYRLGQTLDDGLQDMAARCNDPFITAMVIALIIGKRTGGNISATLRRIAHATREAVRVELELRTKTKGQRGQFYLILFLYPVGLVSIKQFLPQVWDVLTNSYAGKLTLLFSMMAVAGAIYWARKILNPKNL
ncbi:MAG: type II secretion system F family protein [Myxococcales bacterium]|nr:type II secretion system F family protein [Myxococcota bacterium]MDW8282501.1 type II secretion system F family protein [Myxococcales bacterium]